MSAIQPIVHGGRRCRLSLCVSVLIYLLAVPANADLLGGSSDNLWSIETGNGQGTLIKQGGAFQIEGLAFNTNDRFLYGGATNSLWRIDPKNGQATQVTATGSFTIEGLAFNGDDGFLYAGTGNNLCHE